MKKLTKIMTMTMIIILAVSSIMMLTACNNNKIIGIIQFGNHESLNNCYDGMIEGLKQELGSDYDSYKIERHISNFKPEDSGTQASTLVNKNASIIAGIATSSALAAASAAKEAIPVVYCAVSDPVSCGLSKMPNVAGTSDMLDFDSQLALIKAFIPNVDKIGVIYTLTEDNSKSQIEQLRAKAAALNIGIVAVSITNENEIPTACDKLLATSGLDCITNLTDNTVVGKLDTILEKTNEVNIPVFGSEIEQVEKGCLASASLDYFELGKATGVLMAKILKGELKADAANSLVFDESTLYYSKAAANRLNIKVPTVEGLESVD